MDLRKLDALVAENIFGIPTNSQNEVIQPGLGCGTPHKYSTSIEAAWQVVEKIRTLPHWNGGNLIVNIRQQDNLENGKWFVEVTPTFRPTSTRQPTGISESAPHAICLAALKAVGVEA